MPRVRAGTLRREPYILHAVSSRIFTARVGQNELFIVLEGHVQLEGIAHVHLVSIANGYIARSIDPKDKLLLQRWIHVGRGRLH